MRAALLLLLLAACDDPPASTVVVDETCEDEAAPRLLRRLSHAEYDNTVHDLLGTDLRPALEFASDDRVDGYDNNADALVVTGILVDDYRSAAETLADEADLEALMPCDPAQIDLPCADAFIRDFGARAFRRPMAESEVNRYLDLYEKILAQDGAEDGVRWVLTAMLQSPYFLYRLELGEQRTPGTFELTDYEIASELSYMLWGTMPDEELTAAAATGELRDPDGLKVQAARLAADPRAAANISTFVFAWLELDALATVSRDADTFPGFTTALRDDMATETDMFVSELADNGGTLSDLLLADHTYLSADLVAWYGVSPDLSETGESLFQRVNLDGTNLGGLLTQGSVLVTHAQSDGSGPVHRGVMVRERLLCQPMPLPPPTLNVTPPESDGVSTTRELFEQHSADPTCAVCHKLIDPIGFGFEHFTGAGQWRDTENGEPIDSSGHILNEDDSVDTFDGVQELSELLAARPDVQRCYTKMSLIYATGLDDDSDLECAADALADSVAPGEIGLMDPVLALISLRRFTLRSGAPEEGDTPTADNTP